MVRKVQQLTQEAYAHEGKKRSMSSCQSLNHLRRKYLERPRAPIDVGSSWLSAAVRRKWVISAEGRCTISPFEITTAFLISQWSRTSTIMIIC